jgi:hydroxyacylglutathione hydrolase
VALEDHAGDIFGKARSAWGVSEEEAAALAGLDAAAYLRFEQTGQATAVPDFRRLATRLRLSAECLKAIAAGWLPRPQDLSRWRELRQVTTSEGMAVNCYLVWDPATREAALFDTGWDAQPVFELIDANQLQLKHVFITHTHHDHIAALPDLQRRLPGVEIHSSSPHRPAGSGDRAQAGIAVGSLRVTARPTPGHTGDGTSYVVEGWGGGAPPVVVVGDALFAGSMGRVSAPLFESARRAVGERILSLAADTLVCPGHGPLTTVGEERAQNPFFAGAT